MKRKEVRCLKFPRLKNALLCRILIYVVVIGRFFTSLVIVMNLKFVPEVVKAITCIGFTVGFLIHLIKNSFLLIAMDASLASLHCYNTARKHFSLPESFEVQKIEKKISRFGESCDPIGVFLCPQMLRYKSNAPKTIYSSGIEKIIATYHTDFLDNNQYQLMVNSAKANAKVLKGKKKHRFLDKTQKKSPLNSVIVIVIYAKGVDEEVRKNLFDVVCKNGEDGVNTSILPCVVDLEKQICTFDSLKIPYMGFQYPVKNRGIKIIRKYLFNNKFTFSTSPDTLKPINDMNPEKSLWDFWKKTKRELILNEKESKKRYEKMNNGDIVFEDGYIYLKWQERGVWVAVELIEDLKIAEIDVGCFWDYPKPQRIAKATIKEIETLINTYFAKQGYTTKYVSYE